MAPLASLQSRASSFLLNTSSTLLRRSSSLTARAATSTTTWVPCQGCQSPETFNNKFFFALFAILGVFMVIGGIWFFYFARHGGFRYEPGDWDDCKTAILRRKGPDGRTIASSRSTRTGSVKADRDLERARFAAMSVVAVDEKGRKGILAKRGPLGTHSCTYRDDFTNYDGEKRSVSEAGSLDEEFAKPARQHKKPTRAGEGAYNVDLEAGRSAGHHSKRYKDRDVRSYQHEKAARVGGMNRSADGSHFDFSGSEASSNAGRKQGRERSAVDEAERMERQWRREAQRAAATLAREVEGTEGRASPDKKGTPGKIGARTRSPQKRARSGGNYAFSRPDAGQKPEDSYLNAYMRGR